MLPQRDSCTIFIPQGLFAIYGGTGYAFTGAFLSIVGANVDSSTVKNKLTDVTANARRGDTRVQVSEHLQAGPSLDISGGTQLYQLMVPVPAQPVQVASTAGIKVGDWVRLWITSPNSASRRRLQSVDETVRDGRRLRQAGGSVPSGKVTAYSAAPPSAEHHVPQWFADPKMQAALVAAVNAEWQIADEMAANPNKVSRLWEENLAAAPARLSRAASSTSVDCVDFLLSNLCRFHPSHFAPTQPIL